MGGVSCRRTPERLGVVEIPAQVVFAEEEREILVRLPGPAVLPCHAQPATVRGDVRVVIGKLVDQHPRPGGKRRQRVVAPAARLEVAAGGPQPFEHPVEAVVAKLDADEAVQDEPVPEGRYTQLVSRLAPASHLAISRTCACNSTKSFVPDSGKSGHGIPVLIGINTASRERRGHRAIHESSKTRLA